MGGNDNLKARAKPFAYLIIPGKYRCQRARGSPPCSAAAFFAEVSAEWVALDLFRLLTAVVAVELSLVSTGTCSLSALHAALESLPAPKPSDNITAHASERPTDMSVLDRGHGTDIARQVASLRRQVCAAARHGFVSAWVRIA